MRIACLMGTYGRYTLACESLTCFLNQTALSDASLLILNQHPIKLYFNHPHVRVVNEPEYGSSVREIKNRMIELADPDAEFVHFWDDDDLFLPWHLEDCIKNVKNSVAWKPLRSWFLNNKNEYCLKNNYMESSWIIKAKYIRNFPLDLHPLYIDHPAHLSIIKENMLSQSEQNARASYIYRWSGSKRHLSSFGASIDPDLQRSNLRAARNLNNDVVSHGVLALSNLAPQWRRYMASTRDLMTHNEWVENGKYVMPDHYNGTSAVLKEELFIGVAELSIKVITSGLAARIIKDFFSLCLTEPREDSLECEIPEVAKGIFDIQFDGTEIHRSLVLGNFIPAFVEFLADLYRSYGQHLLFNAAAVSSNNSSVLILGDCGTGKSSLVTFFIEKGFFYIADKYTILAKDEIGGLSGPISFSSSMLPNLSKFPKFCEAVSLEADDQIQIQPEIRWAASESFLQCGIIIIPNFCADAELSMKILTKTEKKIRLQNSIDSIYHGRDHGADLFHFTNNIPALQLNYGCFEQLEGLVDSLVRMSIEPRSDNQTILRLLGGLANYRETPHRKDFPSPSATRRTRKRKFTIGMATHDDYDGVYFSLQAIRMFHSQILDEVEFIVIDNNPHGQAAQALKKLESSIDNYAYIPYSLATGTAAAKQQIFEHAESDFVVCMDSHVFFVPGSLVRLFEYWESDPANYNLLQGPLLKDNLIDVATHMDPGWRLGIYGRWGFDERGRDPDSPPFEIGMQGLGVFACRRDAWPDFNPLFRGFGGEEGYIHQKFRMQSRATLCLPFLRWVHRFDRPLGRSYTVQWECLMRNYLIGYDELGLSATDMLRHMSEILGTEAVELILNAFRREFPGKFTVPLARSIREL